MSVTHCNICDATIDLDKEVEHEQMHIEQGQCPKCGEGLFTYREKETQEVFILCNACGWEAVT